MKLGLIAGNGRFPFLLLDAARAQGLAVTPEQVILTASSSEAYSYLLHLVADPGEAVLTPRPSYPLLPYLASLASVRLQPYSLAKEDHWRVEPSTLEREQSVATRAVITVSPNNPTGSYLDEEELASLLRWTSERRLPLLQDEVFSLFAWDREGATPSVVTASEGLSVALQGLSKCALSPQLKLGWMVLSGEPELVEQARERLAVIADTFLSVSTPTQLALPKLLELTAPTVRAARARIARNLRALRAWVQESSSLTLLPARAGWYAMLRWPGTCSDEEWALRALEVGVLTQPGYLFDFDEDLSVLVLSLLTPEEIFREGLERLASLAHEELRREGA